MSTHDQESPDERVLATRAAGASAAAFLVALYLWQTRDELAMSVPALLLCSVLGLAGVGLCHFGRRLRSRRDPMSDVTFLFSAALPIAAATSGAAWFSGAWLGVTSAVGAMSAGFVTGFLLLCLRLAVQGREQAAR